MRLAQPPDGEAYDQGTRPVQTRAGRLVRHAELVVLAFTVVLALVEAGRIAVLYGGRSLIIAGLATAVYLPLHLWHLHYGLRNERPPRSGATLAVVALVQFAGLALIGPAWSFVLATLATSALIVLRPPWSLAVLALLEPGVSAALVALDRAYARFALVAGIAVAMMAVLGTGWRDPGWYLGVAVAVAFRSRTRTAVLAAVFVLAGAYDVWRTLHSYRRPGDWALRCGRPDQVAR